MFPKRSRDIVAGCIGLAMLLGFAVLQSQERTPPPPSVFSTYDFGRNGYAALAELLDREGIRTAAFARPLALLSSEVRTLVISADATNQPEGEFTRGDADALLAWVRRGGRLVALGDPAVTRDPRFKVPSSQPQRRASAYATAVARFAPVAVRRVDGAFARAYPARVARRVAVELKARGKIVGIAYPLGRGRVIAITDASIFSNRTLARAGNAGYAYDLLAVGFVAFDERVHGYAEDRSFWAALPTPVHVAIFIALAIVALVLVGANLRFAPALPADSAGDRDSAAYIDSMARLLARGGAARRALADCVDSVARAAARIDRDGWRETLRELEALRRVERPSAADLVRAGQLSTRLRKDLE